jgi:molecular chaperone GrpE (heat shock protein)
MNPFEALAQAHARAWMDLAASTAAVVQLPARTLHALTGIGSAPEPSATEKLAAEAAYWRADAQQALQTLEKLELDQAARLKLVDELRRAYAALEQEAAARAAQAAADQARTIYGVLEPLLTQLPAVRRSVADGKEVAAADVLALLTPLDEMMAGLGFRPIGAVGGEAAFDPTRHQIASGAAPEPGAPVTVKTVGYEQDGRILRRARVTRAKSPAPGDAGR